MPTKLLPVIALDETVQYRAGHRNQARILAVVWYKRTNHNAEGPDRNVFIGMAVCAVRIGKVCVIDG